ncbi:MAG: hypothetical protein ACR652_21150 [Methylocystis sp.]|uniref:hypothetical protein n=1 Tax=Methylocystis sp. TaxID=1911079 RepID=UPI003DA5C83B
MGVVDAFGGIPAIRLRRANGTVAAPTAIQSGDDIGELEFSGYYTTGGAAFSTKSANLRAEATQNWTSTTLGTRLVAQVTPNGSASPIDSLWLEQDSSLRVKGPIGYQTGIGAGGSVSQATSRTTGVTLNKPTGSILLVSGTGAAYNTVGQTFFLTNSFIAAGDILIVNVTPGNGAAVQYWANAYCVAGGAYITLWCYNYGTADQPTVNFAVIKGATS